MTDIAIHDVADASNQVPLIDPALVRAALSRIREHRLFSGSPSLMRFLEFVISETVAGRGDRLKAYTIATGALGRSADFDPAENPIVRVEATRLRRKLDIYYASEGRNDPLRFRLATGAYRVDFEQPNAASDRPTPLVTSSVVASQQQRNDRFVWLAGAALALAVLSLLMQILVFSSQPSRAAADPRPVASQCSATALVTPTAR